jgi:hypothetical protein
LLTIERSSARFFATSTFQMGRSTFRDKFSGRPRRTLNFVKEYWSDGYNPEQTATKERTTDPVPSWRPVQLDTIAESVVITMSELCISTMSTGERIRLSLAYAPIVTTSSLARSIGRKKNEGKL